MSAFWICNCRHPNTKVYYADEMEQLEKELQFVMKFSETQQFAEEFSTKRLTRESLRAFMKECPEPE